MVKGCARGAHLARVVDHGLVRDVVGVDFDLEVGLWILGAAVDEGFHDLVLPDVVVGALRGIVVEACFVVGGKGQVEEGGTVTEGNLCKGKGR